MTRCRRAKRSTQEKRLTPQGFRLWEAGQYDQAIAALKSFTAAYPKHRRVSYANNLIGRSLLDKGDARGAASALLANYRTNPSGERAPDSLLYLGQALMKLGQPGQACKAYGELDAVYGAKVRPDLKKLEADAKAPPNAHDDRIADTGWCCIHCGFAFDLLISGARTESRGPDGSSNS